MLFVFGEQIHMIYKKFENTLLGWVMVDGIE
jgi:hypothetical protein